MQGPGGTPWRDEGITGVPLPLTIVRKEPYTDLGTADARAWLQAAGPLYHLKVGEDITRAGYVVYDTYDARMDPPGRIGYMIAHRPGRSHVAYLRWPWWVEPQVRRLGVGRRMLSLVINDTLWSERPKMLARVPEPHVRAHCFLQVNGFTGVIDRYDPRWMRFEYELRTR